MKENVAVQFVLFEDRPAPSEGFVHFIAAGPGKFHAPASDTAIELVLHQSELERPRPSFQKVK